MVWSSISHVVTVYHLLGKAWQGTCPISQPRQPSTSHDTHCCDSWSSLTAPCHSKAHFWLFQWLNLFPKRQTPKLVLEGGEKKGLPLTFQMGPQHWGIKPAEGQIQEATYAPQHPECNHPGRERGCLDEKCSTGASLFIHAQHRQVG